MTHQSRASFSIYESVDIVRRKYQERHALDLATGKAREIASHVSQGREFFQSASTASELVRPLLLYYGVLALTRAVILFSRPTFRETALSKGHGLDTIDWTGTLAAGLHAIPDLRVRVTRGTFRELLETPREGEWLEDTDENPLFPARVRVHRTLELDSVPEYSFGSVLARMPDLAWTYYQAFDRWPKCYPCRFSGLQKKDTRVDVFLLGPNLPAINDLRADFALGPGVRIEHNKSQRTVLLDPRPYLAFDWPKEHEDDIPPISYNGDRSTYLVAPFGDAPSLDDFTTYFLVAYVVGMFVRYYPSHWANLLGGTRGDHMYPVLLKCTELLQARFPEIALRELGA